MWHTDFVFEAVILPDLYWYYWFHTTATKFIIGATHFEPQLGLLVPFEGQIRVILNHKSSVFLFFSANLFSISLAMEVFIDSDFVAILEHTAIRGARVCFGTPKWVIVMMSVDDGSKNCWLLKINIFILTFTNSGDITVLVNSIPYDRTVGSTWSPRLCSRIPLLHW